MFGTPPARFTVNQKRKEEKKRAMCSAEATRVSIRHHATPSDRTRVPHPEEEGDGAAAVEPRGVKAQSVVMWQPAT